MSKKIIVGNWKMHLNPHEASLLMHKLDEKIQAKNSVQVVICPPFIDLYSVSKDIDKDKFKLGAQNLHYRDEGAFTGEVSAQMLKSLVSHAIIGHSERREYFNEDDKLIAEKLAAAVRNELTAILCVGESLLDREHGLSIKVVTDQLSANLAMVTEDEVKDLVVAYEPVWAIGTGEFATPDQVAPVISAIRRTVEELYGESAGAGVKVLYGGSVEPDNCKAYLNLEGVDGLLVGGASIHWEKFSSIVKIAQEEA